MLRGAGLPRHTLRLRDSDEALREAAVEVLRPVLPATGSMSRRTTSWRGSLPQRTPGPPIAPCPTRSASTRPGLASGRRPALWFWTSRDPVNRCWQPAAMTTLNWMPAARRAAGSLRATTLRTSGAKHSVYVVLLHHPAVPERWGLYVGQTSRDPDWRFDQHKLGYKVRHVLAAGVGQTSESNAAVGVAGD